MIIGMLMKLDKQTREPLLKNLIDYFRKGIEEFQNNGEKSEQIEWICKGLRRLVNKAKECNYIPATGKFNQCYYETIIR